MNEENRTQSVVMYYICNLLLSCDQLFGLLSRCCSLLLLLLIRSVKFLRMCTTEAPTGRRICEAAIVPLSTLLQESLSSASEFMTSG